MRLSIAPMMDVTDRHFRYLMRLLNPCLWLYTEMVHVGALVHGHSEQFLAHHPLEYPVVLQMGGSNPSDLAKAAILGEQAGFNEINLNVGCPSERVQAGRFGACLMKDPKTVSDCVSAMQKAISIPVTVKTRIGVDDCDSFEFLADFIDRVADAGCQHFIIHARKAWLQGLSPKENRSIPPLDYDKVIHLKAKFPHLGFEVNGGIQSTDNLSSFSSLDGVMLGRIAKSNPMAIIDIAHVLQVCSATKPTRRDLLMQYMQYALEELSRGTPLRPLVQPLLGLFQGMPKAKDWRRLFSELPRQPQPLQALKSTILVVQDTL